MTMRKISAKRKASTRLRYNSTFGVMKSTDRKANKRPKDRRYWKSKAWEHFSRFIRLRDADQYGIATCCTCGRSKPWKQLQAGHYITRAREATLFDERNVHAQCAGCNKWQGGRPLDYEVFLDRRYGEGTAEQIRAKARMECKRTIHDYQFIAETYRERVEWIKKHEPEKYLRGA